jgi:HSP20 family protein
MLRDFDRMFDEGGMTRLSTWMPRLDVFDREDTLVVRAELPGIDGDSLDVTVEAGTLMITGSRTLSSEENKDAYHRKEIAEGSFKRTVLLPEGTDPEAISASSKDGILEIVIPKKPEILPRKVNVDVQR